MNINKQKQKNMTHTSTQTKANKMNETQIRQAINEATTIEELNTLAEALGILEDSHRAKHGGLFFTKCTFLAALVLIGSAIYGAYYPAAAGAALNIAALGAGLSSFAGSFFMVAAVYKSRQGKY
jgi:hypothetical protein